MSQPYSAKRKFGRVLTAFSAVLGATILACILLWPRQRLLLREARQLPLTANNFFFERGSVCRERMAQQS